jgi:Tol biopolymer transport system component
MSVGYQNGTGEIAKIFYQPVPTGVEPEISAPVAFSSPWPSPSRGSVNFAFALANPGRAELTIYDVTGRVSRRLMRESEQGSGRHTLIWDGRTESGDLVSPGVYLARLVVNGAAFTRRVVMTH